MPKDDGKSSSSSIETNNIFVSSLCECGAVEVRFPASAVTTAKVTTTTTNDNVIIYDDNTNINNHNANGDTDRRYYDQQSKKATSKTPIITTTAAVDCHCPSCRKYHVAAFVSYVRVPSALVQIHIDPTMTTDRSLHRQIRSDNNDENDDNDDNYREFIGTYSDYCSGSWGIPGASPSSVHRKYCKRCSSKLFTEPIGPVLGRPQNQEILINMGPLLDETIPFHLAMQWRQQKPNLRPLDTANKSMEQRVVDSQFGRMQWKVSETAAWTWALPKYKKKGINNDDDGDDDEEEEEDINSFVDDDDDEDEEDENENDYEDENDYDVDNNGDYNDDADDDDENIVQSRSPNGSITTRSVSTMMRGGCACGKCQYEFQLQAPTELQHCYCTLCRNLSGGPFMTWIPIELSLFRWISTTMSIDDDLYYPKYQQNNLPALSSWSDVVTGTETGKTTEVSSSLPGSGNGIIDVDNSSSIDAHHLLERYTGHGQRHVCTECRSAMSIRYDCDGDEVLWIAAATIDTIHIPSIYTAIDKYLERVVHICCRSKQNWYELPKDGMNRIDDAS